MSEPTPSLPASIRDELPPSTISLLAEYRSALFEAWKVAGQAFFEFDADKRVVEASAALEAHLLALCADAERLDALDCFCRRIALHAVKGTEPRGGYVFRWQIDHYGPGSPRPSIRDAIDASRTSPDGPPEDTTPHA